MESAQTARYAAQARALARAIDAYFGGEVGGYDTYRYYAGNTLLRSWICMPLIVGLKERSEGTVRALLGPELMTDDGLLSQQGSSTFWDRSTLYALRGIYNVGQADRATELLHRYSQRRLLGDHVPYPIEAWPEGSQRHLSAESGLYCRIITEAPYPGVRLRFRHHGRARGGRQAPHYGGPARRKTENIPRGTRRDDTGETNRLTIRFTYEPFPLLRHFVCIVLRGRLLVRPRD